MSLENTIAAAVREVVREEIRAFVSEVRKAADDRVVTPKEAADMLGLGTATVARMIRDGRLPSFTVGRFRRIRVSDLPQRRQ